MEFKIIYNGLIYIEATATSEEERKEIVKGIKYTLQDLGYEQPTEEQSQEMPKDASNCQSVERLASAKQKAFMDKLHITYNEFTTMVEAADLIKSWKIAHGYDVE